MIHVYLLNAVLQQVNNSVMTITGLVKNHFRLAAYHLTGNMQMLHQHTKKVKNTTQQITDQSLSLVSVVKLWNMSLQNTYLTIWKATVYYMIFNMASDILDPVKPNYCPLFKNLLQIQIKIFKPISLSWTLPKPLTKFHINDFYTNSNFMESRIKH